jgi:hypothetical protein
MMQTVNSARDSRKANLYKGRYEMDDYYYLYLLRASVAFAVDTTKPFDRLGYDLFSLCVLIYEEAS